METPTPTTPAHRLALLKDQIRECIVSETFQLPLHTYTKRFNFATLSYELCRKGSMVVSLGTIGTVTRLLEIVEVVCALLEKEEFITKRNLYYKLVHYYRHYALVDDDIELLSFNTGLEREDMRIVSSSRCLLLGSLMLHIDNTQLACQSHLITHVSSFRTLKGVETTCKTLFIVEKESAMHQITQEVSSHTGQPPYWLKDTIFITAKGYPDSACRSIVQQLAQKMERVFYLGDEDIYGVDILLTYAIGFGRFATILPSITWLDLASLCDQQLLEREYQPISKQDKAKCLELLSREYLKDIQDYLPHTSFEHAFKNKMLKVRDRLRRMREKDKKVELESIFKFLPAGWMERVINGVQ